MGLIRNIKNKIRLLYDDKYRWYYYATKGKYNDMDDAEYLKKYYEYRMGKPLNLENPRTFNEKLQ